MLIKGEGVPANASAAVELYQKAAQQNNIRALNGLGYVYFNGQGVEKVGSFLVAPSSLVCPIVCLDPCPLTEPHRLTRVLRESRAVSAGGRQPVQHWLVLL